MFQVLQGQINLDHFQDLIETKKVIDYIKSTLEESPEVSLHGKIFSLAANYFQLEFEERISKMEGEFERKLDDKRIEFEERISKMETEFEKKIAKKDTYKQLELEDKDAIETELKAKYLTATFRNFNELKKAQKESDCLRQFNMKLITECCELRKENKDLMEKTITCKGKHATGMK